jgi:hypothetical protein
MAGFTLVEAMMSTAIGGFVFAALFTGSLTMQRCFSAVQDYAFATTDQARLSDYLALDLRRALSLTLGTDGTTILTLKMPQYYGDDGLPRTPTIIKYQASYGALDSRVTVVYKKVGNTIVRQEDAKPAVEVAVNVQDFEMKLEDLGKVVKTQITFVPQFQRKLPTSARPETAVFSTTLLRNQRK